MIFDVEMLPSPFFPSSLKSGLNQLASFSPCCAFSATLSYFWSVQATVEYSLLACCLVHKNGSGDGDSSSGRQEGIEGYVGHYMFSFVFVEIRVWGIKEILKLMQVCSFSFCFLLFCMGLFNGALLFI